MFSKDLAYKKNVEIDENTVLLLHFDESTVTDESIYHQTVVEASTNPNLTRITSNGKFGNAREIYGYSSHASTYGRAYYVEDNENIRLGNTFTIDFWFKIISGWSLNGGRVLFEKGFYSGNDYNFKIGCAYNSTYNYYVSFWEGLGTSQLTSMNISVSTDEWHHFAITQNSNSIKLYIDGILKGEYSGTTGSVTGGSYPLNILDGRHTWNGGNTIIDEFRVSKGVVRWDSNFTPPTKPYE